MISYIKKKKIKCTKSNKFNFFQTINYVHVIGHDISYNFIKKIKFSFNQVKIFESNIFGIKSNYEKFLNESWQLNKWNNFKYLLSGGEKNYSILPSPVNYELLLNYKKKIKKIYRNPFSILKVSQNSEGKWSKEIIEVFNKVYYKNKNINLTLVTPTKTIIREIKKLSPEIKNKIKIIKKIKNTKEIYKLYLKSNIFLHLTQQGETFGYVFFEANFFDCRVVCNETPWADNSQVEILRELYSSKCLYNNNKSIVNSLEKLILQKKNHFFKKKYEYKYSQKNICRQAIKLMASRKKNIQKFNKQDMYDLLSYSNKDLLSTFKSLFLKSIVYLFSIYSLVIFKKLKRLNLL